MSNPLARTVDSVIFAGTTAATVTMAGTLDCQDAMYAMITVAVSAEANTNSTNVVISVLEDDTTVVTNFATFDADHERTIDNTAAAIGTFVVDLRGRQRYLRVSATPDTTTNGAVIVSATGHLLKIHDGAIAATKTV